MKVAMKRLMDICGALFGLIVLSPVLLTFIAISYVTMGSPVFFTQLRPGKDGKLFKILKLRTMLDTKDEDGILLSDEHRITRIGALMRKLSVDELPELWNVLKGEMSLVGPRPLHVEYLPLYNHRQAKRHAMKPGITGLAQVCGRNELDWETRFEHDVFYVENWTIKMDLWILLKTFCVVLGQRGVAAQGHVTMPKFKGSPATNHIQES